MSKKLILQKNFSKPSDDKNHEQVLFVEIKLYSAESFLEYVVF